MRQKTGWLEKHVSGVVQSIVEVHYHRIKIKKTPRKKLLGKGSPALPDDNLYFVIDKKVSYGELYLTGDSVFTAKEVIELHLFISAHKTKMRVLARIIRTETFFELKRLMFRAEIQFAAVNKEDFLRVQALEKARLNEKARFKPNPPTLPSGQKMTLTFKRKQ
jgi:hypothetical protein